MKVQIAQAAFAAAAWLVSQIKTSVSYEDVVGWFESHASMKAETPALVAFTLLESDKGQVRLIQGLFSKESSNVVAGRIWRADKLDARLAEAHAESAVVVFE